MIRYALTAEQALHMEGEAIAHGAVTLEALMDRAGTELADAITCSVPLGPVVVLAGKGNNGGDGWVAAKLLHASGRDVELLAFAGPEALSGAAAAAARAAIDAGVRWSEPDTALDVTTALAGATVAIDALFGFGFRGEATGMFASAIDALNDSDTFVVAADVPSGVHADTGVVKDSAVRADLTVTFTAPKVGLLLEPGATFAGQIEVAGLGIPEVYVDRAGCLEIWDGAEYASLLPRPASTDHKGSRGRVLVVAGSRAYAGAAVLTARGASRMGAGYVYAAVPQSIAHIVQTSLPHVITRALPEAADGSFSSEATELLRRMAAESDAVVVGPGLTTGAGSIACVRSLVNAVSVPMVIDADAINAFVADGSAAILSREAPTVVTPHAGELGRLLGIDADEVQADRVGNAAALSTHSVACLLKGARTVISGNGRAIVTMAGNPGMATAGMGDLLAGMIGTLLAQGLSPLEAAALGAQIHARAGDHGAEALTQTCLTAEDLPAFIPRAVMDLLAP